MKLEVGQKIGIYEALLSKSIGKNEPYAIKSKCYLGLKSSVLNGVNLLDEDVIPDSLGFLYTSEVRKVGSLIVKRLK